MSHLARKTGGGSRVYATLDPDSKSTSITLTNGNLTYASSVASVSAFATIGKPISEGGKWYFEAKIDILGAQNNRVIGLANKDASVSNYTGQNPDSIGVQLGKGALAAQAIYNAAYIGTSVPIPNVVQGMVFGILVDLTADEISINVNGGAFSKYPGNSIFLLSTVADAYSGAPKLLFPSVSAITNNAQQTTINFGATPFAHTVPTGANAGWYTGA